MWLAITIIITCISTLMNKNNHHFAVPTGLGFRVLFHRFNFDFAGYRLNYFWGRYQSRTGSTRIASPGRINSDQLRSSRITKKHKIKWNIETFTHLKVKFRLKMGHIKKDLRRFSVSCCVVKPPFCILSTSSSHRLPKLKICGVCNSLWNNSFL